jgi:hypothetical protein
VDKDGIYSNILLFEQVMHFQFGKSGPRMEGCVLRSGVVIQGKGRALELQVEGIVRIIDAVREFLPLGFFKAALALANARSPAIWTVLNTSVRPGCESAGAIDRGALDDGELVSHGCPPLCREAGDGELV